ncbi:MAG: hypothetical protein V8S95_03980 [Odoribacter sp.]
MYDALVFYGDLSYKDAGDYKAMIPFGRKDQAGISYYLCFAEDSRTRVARWLYEMYQRSILKIIA